MPPPPGLQCTAAAQQAPRRLPGLTGLRGVAALWVVAYHLHVAGAPFGSPASQGWMGVDVFFILSGFVLAYVHAGGFPAWRIAGYGRFLWLRLTRIFPLHLAVMAVLGLLVWGLAAPGVPAAPGHGVRSYLIALLLMQNWGFTEPMIWNVPAWSLSAEWLAYLLFPALIWATQWPRSPRLAVLLALAALAGFSAWAVRRGYSSADIIGPDGQARMLAEFAAGALLLRARALPGFRVPRLALPACLALLMASGAGGRLSFLALLGFALLVVLAAQEGSATARALGWRPVVLLGEISYSLYLVHWTVLSLFQHFQDRLPDWCDARTWAGSLVQLVASVAISLATYCLIERPARAIGRSLATA